MSDSVCFCPHYWEIEEYYRFSLIFFDVRDINNVDTMGKNIDLGEQLSSLDVFHRDITSHTQGNSCGKLQITMSAIIT